MEDLHQWNGRVVRSTVVRGLSQILCSLWCLSDTVARQICFGTWWEKNQVLRQQDLNCTGSNIVLLKYVVKFQTEMSTKRNPYCRYFLLVIFISYYLYFIIIVIRIIIITKAIITIIRNIIYIHNIIYTIIIIIIITRWERSNKGTTKGDCAEALNSYWQVLK